MSYLISSAYAWFYSRPSQFFRYNYVDYYVKNKNKAWMKKSDKWALDKQDDLVKLLKENDVY